MEDLNRREKYEAFVNELAGIKSVTALKALMRNDEFKEQIMSGLRFEKLSDTQLKQVFLVYYDQRDDTVFEIMSPQDADGMRWNITTGQLAEPLAYRIAPLWLRYNY